MTVSEISSLRKDGKFQEAYNECEQLLSQYPDDRYVRTTMAWCIKSLAESHAKASNYKEFAEVLSKLTPLKLSDIGELSMTNRFAWDIKTLFDNLKVHPELLQDAALLVFDAIRKLDFFKPHKNYTLILDCFLKVKLRQAAPWGRLCDFIDWWGFDNLLSEDFQRIPLKNGKSIPSVAERTHIVYYKVLMNQISNRVYSTERIDGFLKRLDDLNVAHPEFAYTLYHKSLLLLALNKKDEALDSIRPFVKHKQNEFWVWDVLGDTTENDDIKLSCLCRSLLCRTKPEFIGKVRIKAAQLMIKKELFDNARTELDAFFNTYKTNGWHISTDLESLTKQQWYLSASNLGNNISFYKSHLDPSEQFLFHDMPEIPIIIEHNNKDKHVCHFITKEKKKGFFFTKGVKENFKENTVYLVRLSKKSDSDKAFQLLTHKRDENIDNYIGIFFERFNDKIRIREGNNFGFVNDIFVNLNLDNTLANGDMVTGLSVISYNKKKDTWGWRAISVMK